MWRTSSAAETRETILDLKRTGKTILLTTQNMHEAEQLYGRIAIINKGSLVVVDIAQDLKRKLKTCTVQFVAFAADCGTTHALRICTFRTEIRFSPNTVTKSWDLELWRGCCHKKSRCFINIGITYAG